VTIGDYFNLGKRIWTEQTTRQPVPPPAAPGIAPSPAAAAPTLAPQPARMTVAWQILVYGVLVASIMSSRYLDLYRAGLADQFVLDWRYLLFMSIVSLLAFPVVYDRAMMSTDRPVLVQIGLIFTTGMGWEKIVATAIGK
jgi:hypothetical protein